MKLIQIKFILPIGLFLLFSIPTDVVGQDLNHTWKLTEGWLDQNELHFTRIDNPETYEAWADAFTFAEDGRLMYELMIPEGRGICGNGLLYVEEATYKVNRRKSKIRMYVRGGHYTYDTFEYEIKYKVVSLTEDTLVLRVKKVRKAEVHAEFGTAPIG